MKSEGRRLKTAAPRKTLGDIAKYSVMLFVVIISIFPFIWLFISSFKTNNEILGSAFSWPRTPSLYGYITAIQVTHLHLRFVTSIIISVASTVAALIIYGMAAYVLARCSFKLKNIVFALLISSIMIPSEAMIQPIYTIMNALKLYDTKTALIIVYAGFALPICLFLMRSYFSNLPKEMEESAYMEGAGFFRAFWSIMLPLTKPALISSGIMIFIGGWNELLYAFLLTSSEANRTLPLAMRTFTATFTFNYPPLFAGLVMYVLPTIVIYVLLQEQIAESMVAGAVKG